MPAISASYPGKIILFGEHAVVYGSHAIAIPVNQVSSRAVISPLVKSKPGMVEVIARDIDLHKHLDDLGEQDPIAFCIRSTFQRLNVNTFPSFSIRISSTIPFAAGMGSGASVSCSIAEAISTFMGKPFTPEEVSEVAFEVEKLHHGTPSGVDNTVIAFKRAVYFKRDELPLLLNIGADLVFIIADSGIKSQTADVVNAVRKSKELETEKYDQLFNNINDVAQNAMAEIKKGNLEKIGELMNINHHYLQELGVSHPALDELAAVCRGNGAYGAKLSGAGRGGSIIGLIPPELSDRIGSALLKSGASRILITKLDTSR